MRHYYRALAEVEQQAAAGRPLRDLDIRRIHGLVMSGKPHPTPYRREQNVIRNSQSGAIVYMPPAAKDVPALMADLAGWINQQMYEGDLPVPLIAGLAHYQFATIHPYYDGNGRTARLLATLILHKGGYGLKGIYSLDEYYARNLTGYYEALTLGPSHNYYLGREQAEVTRFLEFFCAGMAEAFSAVRVQAAKAAERGARDQAEELRTLDPRERRLLELFRRQATANTQEIARYLNLKPRTIVGLCREWVAEGFLEVHNPSRKNRSYRLGKAVLPLCK